MSSDTVTRIALIAQAVTTLLSGQKCPFEAIMIINLPKNLEKETTHRYGPNSFKLHRYASLIRLVFMQAIAYLTSIGMSYPAPQDLLSTQLQRRIHKL